MRLAALPGLNRYVVDSSGGVRTLSTLCLMATHLNDEGYPRVRLTCDDGKRRGYTIHKLVALAFLPPPLEEQKYVLHRDGCRTNSAASNLYWGTHADNHRDKKAHGMVRSVKRKLLKHDVKRIRRSKMGAARIAKREGLSIAHVRDIRNGRRWRRGEKS